LTVFAVSSLFAVLTVYTAFSTIATKTQALKIIFFVTTPKTTGNYVVNRVAFKTACLTSVSVAFKYPLPDLAPTCSATSVPQCTCH
jgi:hypothetical protein